MKYRYTLDEITALLAKRFDENADAHTLHISMEVVHSTVSPAATPHAEKLERFGELAAWCDEHGYELTHNDESYFIGRIIINDMTDEQVRDIYERHHLHITFAGLKKDAAGLALISLNSNRESLTLVMLEYAGQQWGYKLNGCSETHRHARVEEFRASWHEAHCIQEQQEETSNHD